MSEETFDSTERPVGWISSVGDFVQADAKVIVASLTSFINRVHDASPGYKQVDAWDDYIPGLQRELRDTVTAHAAASNHLALLEYQFEFDGRRPDFLLLANGTVVVVEFKKKDKVGIADVDQVMGYARDLASYHRACAKRRIVPVLVPTAYKGPRYMRDSVWVCSLVDLDPLVRELDGFGVGEAISADEFVSDDAYCPLPSLVAAARELFELHAVRHVAKAYANTEPAVTTVRDISFLAAKSMTRRLVLLTGVPGAGKTLVGLRAVHAGYLENLRTSSEGAPAVFLSGNGPLVQVLRHVIKNSPTGTSAKASVFVQDVKKFRDRYVSPGRKANQHVIVSDEAQRAWDAAKMQREAEILRSEPDIFIEVSSRVPDWCVFVGLIGGGQEIHEGEEGGVAQWFDAVAMSPHRDEWTVHVPPALAAAAKNRGIKVVEHEALSLDREIRFHQAQHLHKWVEGLLSGGDAGELKQIAKQLRVDGFRMYLTRDLQAARDYASNRYAGHPEARFGIVASSRDVELFRHGIANRFLDTKAIKVGPWFADPQDRVGSGCQLSICVTEFQCQGLELDFAVMGWGTDFIWTGTGWDSSAMRPYKNRKHVLDAHALRMNAYRVLLTRGRDGFVVFVPRIAALNSTADRILECGVQRLDEIASN